jgi:Fe-S cluster assembly protein SufD
VTLQALSQVLAAGEPREANFLARKYDRADEIFARINAALADEGAVLRVGSGTRGTAPVHLVFIGTASEGDRAWHLRHLVELRDGAELTLVEHHLGNGAHSHLGNAVMHVHLGQGAILRHARVQDEALGASLFGRTDAVMARDADYRRLDLELGAGLSRHELNVALHGQGAKLHANGVLLANGKRHLDTRLGIDHVGRDTACELTWRGLGAGRSKAAFHGGIVIREGADGTAPSCRTRTCCSAKARRSTPSRCWRSTPTKCRPRMAPPWASSTRPRCSTCAPAACRPTRRAPCSPRPSAGKRCAYSTMPPCATR